VLAVENGAMDDDDDDAKKLEPWSVGNDVLLNG